MKLFYGSPPTPSAPAFQQRSTVYPGAVDDADPKLSKILLAGAALGATLNLADAVRERGPRNALTLFFLGIGLPAIGEVLATGPLNLLRHRTRPRVAGVPVAILLGWYCAINGCLTVAERVLARLPVSESRRRVLLPLGAALVGTSLDLILDPCGLDVGLWEWRSDGRYAAEIEGPNGRSGVPVINYLGWISLVSGVVYVYEYLSDDDGPSGGSRVSGLLLLPYYLAAVAWAIRKRRFRYLLYSAAFPIALGVNLKQR